MNSDPGRSLTLSVCGLKGINFFDESTEYEPSPKAKISIIKFDSYNHQYNNALIIRVFKMQMITIVKSDYIYFFNQQRYA